MISREFAWRVFAREFNDATLEIPAGEERAPSYIVTPLGARINRVYVAGVLTENEKLERNGSIHYRARVSDRTGVFYIYAGQYDPEACNVLSKIEPPEYIALTGKGRKYSPSEGVSYVSIRPESITVVDKSIRDYWLLDVCRNMKERLEAIVEAGQMSEPDYETLVNLGYGPEMSRGIIAALEHYKKIDIESYKNILVDVLRYLVGGNGKEYAGLSDGTKNDAADLDVEFKTGDELANDDGFDEYEFEPTDEDSGAEADLSEHQEKFMEIITSFKGEEYINGIPWHELVATADSKGIEKNLIEEIVNNLLDTGKIYEPMLGRIKLMET